MENFEYDIDLNNNLYIDYYDQYLQDFLKTIGYDWDRTFISNEGKFIRVVDNLGKDNDFFNGEFKAVFLTDIDTKKQKAQILKATEYSLVFYEFVEDSTKVNKLDQFEVSLDFSNQFQYYMLKEYKEKYLEYIFNIYYESKEDFEESKTNYRYKKCSKNVVNNAYNKMIYFEKLLKNLQANLTDIIEDEKILEALNENSLESLEQILDAETYQMLFPEKELEDEENFKEDGYYFEESDKDDDDEYEK